MMFNWLTIATITAVFACSVTASVPSDCTRRYTVQPGDASCDTIGRENNVSEYQLTLINPEIGENCQNLYPGEVLCLGRKDQDCVNTYVVQPTDTCGTIASSMDINIDVLLQNNLNVGPDCDNIRPGMVLCVAEDTIDYSE